MKDYRTIPAPWPGKKKVKIKYISSVPPRDWKFWAMVVLSAVWFSILTLMLLKSTYVPTVGHWWKDQSILDQSKSVMDQSSEEPAPLNPKKLSGLSIPFPKTGNYYRLSFDALAGFPSESPRLDGAQVESSHKERQLENKLPDSILALDGQKISVAGFMIPMLAERDKVLSFVLAQSQMTCCYGAVPKLNQWIYVKMENGKSADSTMDIPVTVFGSLSVGTKYDQENRGWCLYRMTCEKIDLPKKSWFGL